MREKRAINFELEEKKGETLEEGLRNQLYWRTGKFGKLTWIYVSKDVIDEYSRYTAPHNDTLAGIYLSSSDSDKVILKTGNDKEEIILKRVEAAGDFAWYEVTSFLIIDFRGNEIKYEKPADPHHLFFFTNKFDKRDFL